jgi:predicted nuclease of predicted toxin-antitoxin system
MDVHIPATITRSLFLKGVDVITAQSDGKAEAADSDLLDRATELGRVLFSEDEDLEMIAQCGLPEEFANRVTFLPLRK